jgi:hypothetical protein
MSRCSPCWPRSPTRYGSSSSATWWERSCGSFDVPVGKAALSHHFAALRAAGLVEQRDIGPKRFNRLRRPEFEARFPGLLELVIRDRTAAGPVSCGAQCAPPPALISPDS